MFTHLMQIEYNWFFFLFTIVNAKLKRKSGGLLNVCWFTLKWKFISKCGIFLFVRCFYFQKKIKYALNINSIYILCCYWKCTSKFIRQQERGSETNRIYHTHEETSHYNHLQIFAFRHYLERHTKISNGIFNIGLVWHDMKRYVMVWYGMVSLLIF